MIKQSLILTCLFMLGGMILSVVATPVSLYAGQKNKKTKYKKKSSKQIHPTYYMNNRKKQKK